MGFQKSRQSILFCKHVSAHETRQTFTSIPECIDFDFVFCEHSLNDATEERYGALERFGGLKARSLPVDSNESDILVDMINCQTKDFL